MIKRILSSKYFSIFVAVLILWAGVSLVKIDSQTKESEKEITGLENKVSEIEKGNRYIEKFLTYFKSPAFLEKEARMKLNYKAADENVVFVYLDKSGKTTLTTDFKEKLANMKNYEKWWYYLLGY